MSGPSAQLHPAPSRGVVDFIVSASGLVSRARGIVGLVVPRSFARLAGTRPDATRTRVLFGAREVVLGVGLVTARSSGPWLRARIAGDVVDVLLHTREVMDPAVRSRRTVAALALVVVTLAVDAMLSKAERTR